MRDHLENKGEREALLDKSFQFQFVYVVYAALGALFFMVYLAIDIQMIIGGKKYEINAEDYIFAAIQVFLDIINIFLLILSLIGGNRD